MNELTYSITLSVFIILVVMLIISSFDDDDLKYS
jgi:hypothetical protein